MVHRLFRAVLLVGDLAEAGRLYGALLGSEGERVSRGRLYFPGEGSVLALLDPEREGDTGLEVRANAAPVYVAVDDLDACAARAGGFVMEKGIQDWPWGERSFYVRDPWGNVVCVVEAGTEFLGGAFVE